MKKHFFTFLRQCTRSSLPLFFPSTDDLGWKGQCGTRDSWEEPIGNNQPDWNPVTTTCKVIIMLNNETTLLLEKSIFKSTAYCRHLRVHCVAAHFTYFIRPFAFSLMFLLKYVIYDVVCVPYIYDSNIFVSLLSSQPFCHCSFDY